MSEYYTELDETKAELAEMRAMMRQMQQDQYRQPQVSVRQPMSNVSVVKTQETATGFELLLATIFGLITGGPFGAILSPMALNGFRGKWGAWNALGVIAGPASWFLFLAMVGSANSAELKQYEYQLLPEVQSQLK